MDAIFSAIITFAAANLRAPVHNSLMNKTTQAVDPFITAFDQALRAVFGFQHAQAAYPQPVTHPDTPLTAQECQHAAALMRINHVGEVCAQALYNAQAAATLDPALKRHFLKGAMEEGNHLAWTRQRVEELGGRTSLLNPLWYAGAYTFGRIAGRFGDPTSLGFVVETERQVEAHLDGHLDSLPKNDLVSRAIVSQMKADEVEHAHQAMEKGAIELPGPVKSLMKAAAKVMTTVAYRI
jgi:ubiquinone biosynthesis monooxygenase Coq7